MLLLAMTAIGCPNRDKDIQKAPEHASSTASSARSTTPSDRVAYVVLDRKRMDALGVTYREVADLLELGQKIAFTVAREDADRYELRLHRTPDQEAIMELVLARRTTGAIKMRDIAMLEMRPR